MSLRFPKTANIGPENVNHLENPFLPQFSHFPYNKKILISMNYLANLERYICLNLKPGCFNALLSASLQRNSKNDNHEQEYYKINNMMY